MSLGCSASLFIPLASFFPLAFLLGQSSLVLTLSPKSLLHLPLFARTTFPLLTFTTFAFLSCILFLLQPLPLLSLSPFSLPAITFLPLLPIPLLPLAPFLLLTVTSLALLLIPLSSFRLFPRASFDRFLVPAPLFKKSSLKLLPSPFLFLQHCMCLPDTEISFATSQFCRSLLNLQSLPAHLLLLLTRLLSLSSSLFFLPSSLLLLPSCLLLFPSSLLLFPSSLFLKPSSLLSLSLKLPLLFLLHKLPRQRVTFSKLLTFSYVPEVVKVHPVVLF